MMSLAKARFVQSLRTRENWMSVSRLTVMNAYSTIRTKIVCIDTELILYAGHKCPVFTCIQHCVASTETFPKTPHLVQKHDR